MLDELPSGHLEKEEGPELCSQEGVALCVLAKGETVAALLRGSLERPRQPPHTNHEVSD